MRAFVNVIYLLTGVTSAITVFVDRDVVVSQLHVSVVTVVIAPHRTPDRSRVTGQKSEVKGHWPEVSDQRSRVKGQRSEAKGERPEVTDQWSRVKGRGSEAKGHRPEVKGQKRDRGSQ